MTLVLFVLSMITVYFATQSLVHQRAIVTYEKFLIGHVELKRAELEREYMNFQNGINQL